MACSQEETHHLRLIHVTYRHGAVAARHSLNTHIKRQGCSKLSEWLAPKRRSIYSDTYSKHNKRLITPEQFDRLFPKHKEVSTDDLDISLIAYLLKRFGKEEGLHSRELGKLDIMRQTRNTLAHHAHHKVSQSEFDRLWKTICECICTLKPTDPQIFEDLKQENLDKNASDRFKEQMQKEFEREIQIGYCTMEALAKITDNQQKIQQDQKKVEQRQEQLQDTLESVQDSLRDQEQNIIRQVDSISLEQREAQDENIHAHEETQKLILSIAAKTQTETEESKQDHKETQKLVLSTAAKTQTITEETRQDQKKLEQRQEQLQDTLESVQDSLRDQEQNITRQVDSISLEQREAQDKNIHAHEETQKMVKELHHVLESSRKTSETEDNKVTSQMEKVVVKGDNNTAGVVKKQTKKKKRKKNYDANSSPESASAPAFAPTSALPSAPDAVALQNQQMSGQEFLTLLINTTKQYYKQSYVSFRLPFYDLKSDMDDFYINIHCERPKDDSSFHPKPAEPNPEFAEFKSILKTQFKSGERRAVIQGDGGMGKTTASKKICLDWSRGDAELTESFDIIVRVDLKTIELQAANSVLLMARAIEAAFMYDPINEVSLDCIKSHLRKVLDNERILFIFDGFDEASVKTKEALQIVFFPSDDQPRFLANVSMMLLTRPSCLEAGAVADFVIRPLTDVQRNQFIKRHFRREEPSQPGQPFNEPRHPDQPSQNSEEQMNDFNQMLQESPPIASMAQIPFFLVMMCTLFIKDDFRGMVSNTVELLLGMLGFSLKTVLTKFENQPKRVGILVEKVKNQLRIRKLTFAKSLDILKKTDTEQYVLALGYAIFRLNDGVFSGSNDLNLQEVKEMMMEYLSSEDGEVSDTDESCHVDLILKLSWFSIKSKRQQDGYNEVVLFNHQNLRDIIVAYYLARAFPRHFENIEKSSDVRNSDLCTFRAFMGILRWSDKAQVENTNRLASVCNAMFKANKAAEANYAEYNIIIDLCRINLDWRDWSECPKFEDILSMLHQNWGPLHYNLDISRYIAFVKKNVEDDAKGIFLQYDSFGMQRKKLKYLDLRS